ncbi:MAG: SMP-30/gluconolactonase/LRE family protein, partial [Geminicoccales bacterium]
MAAVDLVLDCRNTLGEGAVWNEVDGLLWWTDIEGGRLWTLEPKRGRSASYQTPERVCCFAPRRNGQGLVVAFSSGFALYDPATGLRRDLVAFEPDQPDTRLNDGRTDRQGRLIAGGFDEKGGGRLISSVVRLDPNLTVTKLFSGVGCANGICFSPDGRTLYFADSMRAEIWAFAYDPDSGRLGGRRVVATLEGSRPGIPDGSCVDAQGCIWNAEWDGGAVVRWTPDGRIDRVVELPVPRPTCVTFGGADYGTLYITTA